MKKLILANFALIVLTLLVIILSFFGIITFGYGLGDIFYAGLAVLSFLIHLLFTIAFHFSRKASSQEYAIMLLIFTMILLYLIYSFTIGRGPE